MGKTRGKGLPYLQTSLKFDLNSSDSLGEDIEASFLEQLDGLIKDEFQNVHIDGNSVSSPRGDEFANERVVVGMQPVLDAMCDGTAAHVLFDAASIGPSAVTSAIGLYILNCQQSVCYCIPGLTQLLGAAGISAEALATTRSEVSFNKLLQSFELRKIDVAQSKNKDSKTALSSPHMFKSCGKKKNT